jgi:predicted enzyme related to lactoylglutathione lyase
MEALPIRKICQIELRTRDLAKAAAFYQGCFDWHFHFTSEKYALVDTGREPVVAMGQVDDPEVPVGIADYVLVPDCDKAGAYASSLGARVIIPKNDAGGGSFVGTLDPWQNEVFFWQPDIEPKIQLRASGRNHVCWLELPAPAEDFRDAISFYARLVRWRFHGVEGVPDYVFTEDGGFSRGIGLVGGERGKRMLSATHYIETPDLLDTAARIKAAGGTVAGEPREIPGEGSFLLFFDPEKIFWGAFQPA